jgi:HNH endonuclease
MGYGYFKGGRCNPDWQQLETAGAAKARGSGWDIFRKVLIAKRGMKCEHCEVTLQELWLRKSNLDIHHIIKIRHARQLRFDESNCLVLCKPCHSRAELASTIPPEDQKTIIAAVSSGEIPLHRFSSMV